MRSSIARVVMLVTATACAIAPGASAATWSPPQPLGPALASGRTIADVRAVSAGGSRTIAAWVETGGPPADDILGIAALDAAGRAGKRAHLKGVPIVRVARYRSGAQVLIERAHDHGATVETATVSPAGVLGARRVLQRTATVGFMSLASNASGLRVAAWTAAEKAAGPTVAYVAVALPGRGFGAPTRVSARSALGIDAAVDDRGNAVVAWAREGAVEVRVRPRGKSSFGSTTRVGHATDPSYRPDVALDGAGRVLVGWDDNEFDCFECPEEGSGTMRAAVGDLTRLGRPRGLDTAELGFDRPDTFFAGPGRGLLLWSGEAGEGTVLRTARADGDALSRGEDVCGGEARQLLDGFARPDGTITAVTRADLRPLLASIDASTTRSTCEPFTPAGGDAVTRLALSPVGSKRLVVVFAAFRGPEPGARVQLQASTG